MITIEDPQRPTLPDPALVPQSVHGNYPVSAEQRALWIAFRQALLMMVDAIEVYIGTETRTSELRKRSR